MAELNPSRSYVTRFGPKKTWADYTTIPFFAQALKKTEADYEKKAAADLQQQQDEAAMARTMAQVNMLEQSGLGDRLQKMWEKAYEQDATWMQMWTDEKTGKIKPGAPKRPLLVFFDQAGPENIRKMGLEGVYNTLTNPPGATASDASDEVTRPGLKPFTYTPPPSMRPLPQGATESAQIARSAIDPIQQFLQGLVPYGVGGSMQPGAALPMLPSGPGQAVVSGAGQTGYKAGANILDAFKALYGG